jgi:hypothetical protein
MEPMRLLVTDAAAQPPRQATAWLIMTLGRRKSMQFTLTFISLFLVVTGFASQRDTSVTSPIALRNYDALFRFVGQKELVEIGYVASLTPEVVLKLAAESKIEFMDVDGQMFAVVEPHYYSEKQLVDTVRGASGNGSYYILCLSESQNADARFKLLGIADGNQYRWMIVNRIPVFVTRWHVSSNESPESFYRLQGDVFKRTLETN